MFLREAGSYDETTHLNNDRVSLCMKWSCMKRKEKFSGKI